MRPGSVSILLSQPLVGRNMGGLERRLIDEGVAYYIPLRYSELPRYYQENVDSVHVAMVQVSPMDEGRRLHTSLYGHQGPSSPIAQ